MKKAYKNPDAVTYYIKEREYFGWRPRGERAVKFAEIKPGDYVLDLCCGPGMVSKVIREFVGDKGKVIGIDISPKFIKYANQLCNYPNVSFFKGNVENFDTYTHAEKFDAIVLLASWYWIKNKDQLLKKIKLNLKPNGRLLISLSADNLKNPQTHQFFLHYRNNLKRVISETFPDIDPSYLDCLTTANEEYFDEIISQVCHEGYRLCSKNETKRQLTLADKLFTYENPARTEWVGNFSSKVRYQIIKDALTKTGSELKNLQTIERHTYYLEFCTCTDSLLEDLKTQDQ